MHDGLAYYDIDTNGGHGVVLRTNQTYDYNGQQAYFKSIYWHLCDPEKEPQYASLVYRYQQQHSGEPMLVKAGDIIGYADNTGMSDGDHLHVGLKPQAQGERDWIWYNIEQQNGFRGCIDPTPYFNNQDPIIRAIKTAIINLAQKALALLFLLKKQTQAPIVPDESIPPPAEPIQTQPIQHMTIKQLGDAVVSFEDTGDKTLNNPFALRSSPFQAGQKVQQSTGKLLSFFNTYEEGYAAGIHQFTIICNGTSPVYNAKAKLLGLADSSCLTLAQTIAIYAPSTDQNNPGQYAASIAKTLGVPVTIQMKEFS